jgi:hypothetical protein
MRHAKLPAFLPLPLAVQHGWQRLAHEFESSSKPPEIWVWSPRMAGQLAQYYPSAKIRVVGSFFCYFIQSLKDEIKGSVDKRGSVCIPPHSSHFVKASYSVEDFARRLNDLPADFKPIRIMLYYLDMTAEIAGVYQKYGFDIVTNGSLFDDDFIARFVKHVQDKKHCIYSELGSGVLFSEKLGVKRHRIPIETIFENDGNHSLTHDYISTSLLFDDGFLERLDDDLLNEELGEKYMLTSVEMRILILKSYLSKEFFVTIARRCAGTVLRKLGFLKKNA